VTTLLSDLDPDLEFDEDALVAAQEAGQLDFDEPEELDEESLDFVRNLVDKCMLFANALGKQPLYPYQEDFARRCFESIILNDGAKLTALWSRQAGKTQAVAYVIATVMVLFPILAKIYPRFFSQYENGVLVGTFAPTEQQAETLFQRIQLLLDSEHARDILSDEEIGEEVMVSGKVLTLKKSKSLCRMQTANPKAQVESKTYHLIVLDEAQGAQDQMVNKSIRPMLASTNGTSIYTGTPTSSKNVFYEQIQSNKRRDAKRKGSQDHFQHDWRSCAKYNPRYKKFVQGEIATMGADSDEFLLSYALKWLLEQGMFTTEERLEQLGDKSMQSLVTQWKKSPIVLGIDPARKQDSTVVTAVWVDWDNPDENGYFDHRVLNWLEMHGTRWEDQYARIVDFASNYNVIIAAVDGSGVGDVVTDRLALLMPRTQVIPLSSNTPDQSSRWKHMTELMNKGLVGWPAGSQVRKKRVYRRFIQQMGDLQQTWKGPHMLAAAPDLVNCHDDFCDSLALALYATKTATMPEIEQSSNPLYR
jgi:hypothetical protein